MRTLFKVGVVAVMALGLAACGTQQPERTVGGCTVGAGGGAGAGAALGLLGGPLAPATVPAGAAAGALFGGIAGCAGSAASPNVVNMGPVPGSY